MTYLNFILAWSLLIWCAWFEPLLHEEGRTTSGCFCAAPAWTRLARSDKETAVDLIRVYFPHKQMLVIPVTLTKLCGRAARSISSAPAESAV